MNNLSFCDCLSSLYHDIHKYMTGLSAPFEILYEKFRGID